MTSFPFLYRLLSSRFLPRNNSSLVRRLISSAASSATLHEESAGGLNGRLARLSLSSSPADLLAFYNRLTVPDRSHLNLISFKYILTAMLADGRQMDAFRLINQLEASSSENGFPDKSSFLILMRGLVDADISGSLALAVDEIFELMVKGHNIPADLQAWSLRIKAFLHSKFMNNHNPALEPSRIFYKEMIQSMELEQARDLDQQYIYALNELRTELIITAVNRRIWSFSEWMLSELAASSPNSQAQQAHYIFIDKIASASGLFTDASSLPVIRYLLANNSSKTNSVLLNSIGFNQQLLLFCWRQGRSSADLAHLALRFLLRADPQRNNLWIDSAEGCLRRELPRDYYTFESDEARDRLTTTLNRIKCSESQIKDLEMEILHQKLLL